MKTLIITDPCYLIKDSEWDDTCRYCFRNEEGKNQTKELVKFRKFIQELLRINSGDKKAVAGDTGFGDWCNEIDGQQFYADSGMVCVVEYTNKLKKYLDKENILLPIGVAYVEVDDNATYKIDTSNPNWSVVRIHSGNELIESLPAE